jgi:putative membrane protein
MSWQEFHPALNAALNATSGVFVVLGLRAIASGNREAHRRCMQRAILVSALFLISYLIRVAISGTHRYPGDGWDRTLYLVILTSHTILAIIVAPLILRTAYVALRGRFDVHRRLVRFTAPIWLYVSATGVIVYVMLYHVSKW